MADIRLTNFPAKTAPDSADIVFIGDSVDSFREKKSTVDQLAQKITRYEKVLLSATQDLDISLVGKLIINDTVSGIQLRLPIGLVLPIGSQFRVFRGDTGEFAVRSSNAAVTINDAPLGIASLVSQYDSAIFTYTALDTYIVSYYSKSVVPVDRKIAYENGAGASVFLAQGRPWENYGFNRKVPLGSTTVNVGGSGYSGSPVTGDLIQVLGGIGAPAIFRVLSTGIFNSISSLGLVFAGDYSVFPGITNVPTVAITGSGDNLATVNIGSEPVVSYSMTDGASHIRGPITFGGPNLPFQPPPWADAQFLAHGGYGKGVWFQPRTQVEVAYMQTELPLDGLFFYNGNTGHFGTFVANQPRDIAYTLDIPTTTHAEMYFQGNANATPIIAQLSPVVIVGTYVSGLLSNFTFLGNELIKAGPTEVVHLTAMASGIFETTTNKVSISLYKNGAIIPKSKMPIFWGPSSPASSPLLCQCLVSLAAGDSITARIENYDSLDNPTVTELSVIATKP